MLTTYPGSFPLFNQIPKELPLTLLLVTVFVLPLPSKRIPVDMPVSVLVFITQFDEDEKINGVRVFNGIAARVVKSQLLTFIPIHEDINKTCPVWPP